MKRSIELDGIIPVLTELFTIARENALTTATDNQIQTLDENYQIAMNSIIPYINYVKDVIGDRETITSSGRTNVPVILYPVVDGDVTSITYQEEGSIKYNQPPLDRSPDRGRKYPLVTAYTRTESRPITSSTERESPIYKHTPRDKLAEISPRQLILSETRTTPEKSLDDRSFRMKVNISDTMESFPITINPQRTYDSIIEIAAYDFHLDPNLYDLVIDDIRVDPDSYVHYSTLRDVDGMTLLRRTEPILPVILTTLQGDRTEVRFSRTSTFGDMIKDAKEQLKLTSGDYAIIIRGKSMPNNMIIGDRDIMKVGTLHLVPR